MAAVTTRNASVRRAIDFYNKTDLWFAIGKTSAWANESSPPAPTATDSMTEIIGYRKVSVKYLVIPYDGRQLQSGDIKITLADGSQWFVISPANAYTEGAKYVYVETTVFPSDFPAGDYRQVGLFSGLVPQAGVNKDYLLPSEVQSQGVLEVIDNRVKSTRTSTTKEQLSFVIQF